MRKNIIIIFGPTAVGKTDFAETLAQQLPSEIVNADLGQFYTPFTIGTAKPDWHTSPIKQHLFDCINEPRMISVTQYRDKIIQVFEEIWERNATPIVVGGSGFYLKSLFFPPQAGNVVSPEETKKIKESERWNYLYSVDPARAVRLHTNDMYRINRALDIYFGTGKKPSEHVPQYHPLGAFSFVYLTRDRQNLYDRIDLRTRLMLKEGWIEEVARIKNTAWEPFLKKKKLIGYDDILEYLDGDKSEKSYHHLVEVIASKTRNYAKRQMTFGNQLFEQLQQVVYQTSDSKSTCTRFDLTNGNLELYINQLIKSVQSKHSFE